MKINEKRVKRNEKRFIVGRMSLLVAIFIMLSSFVTADLSDGLTAYYSFDDNPFTTNLMDSVGNNHSTADQVRGRTNLESMNGFAWNFSVFDDDDVTMPVSIINGMAHVTVSTWARLEGSLWQSEDDGAIFYGHTGADETGMWINKNDNVIGGKFTVQGSTESATTLNAVNDNQWYMYTMRYNGTHASFWIDGVQQASFTRIGTPVSVTTNFQIGGRFPDTWNWNGQIDEMGVWNRALTRNEIQSLYNTGSGSFYPFGGVSPPTLLNQTALNLTSSPVNLGFNVSDNFDNCSLFTNRTNSFTFQASVSPIVNNTEYSFNYDANNGDIAYYVDCRLNGDSEISDTRTFYLDSFPPVISTTYPSESGTTTLLYNETFQINTTFTDNLGLFSYNYTINEGGIQKISNASLITGLSYNLLETVDITSLNNATHNINITLCDYHTKDTIKPYDVGQWDGEKLTMAWDNDVIEIYSLDDYIDEIELEYELDDDRVKFLVTYNTYTLVKKFKIINTPNVVYLPNSEYKGHFVFDFGSADRKYWLDFEQEGHVVVTKNLADDYIINVYNDDNTILFNSIGFLNCISESYDFEILSSLPSDTEPSDYGIELVPTNFYNNQVLDATTTSGALMYFFIFFIFIFLIVYAEKTGIPAMFLFSTFYGFILGWVLFTTISPFIGVFVILTGVMLGIRGVWLSNN